MFIRKEDVSVEKILSGAEFLGSGASKEGYLKNGIVYKVPRGRYLIQQGGFGDELKYPSTMDEIDEFLEDVDAYEASLVWPLGQFATELVVWDAIKQLREEGLAIDCFAEIKDFYLDKDGVIIIEQEETKGMYGIDDDKYEEMFDALMDEIDMLKPIFSERFNIKLRDIREGNCGKVGDRIKLFDFGVSTSTSLDDYGSYSDYGRNDSEEDYNYESYESYED